VSYAIGSYIYRWVVTFAILWFLDSFLKPYKLDVLSHMLAFAAAGSMVGWPLYRLGKSIYKRGRLPDMKKWRVLVSTGILTAAILFVCLVPVPVSRIRGRALVQAHPDATARVYVRHDGILKKLNIRPGDTVKAGDELAVFEDRDLDAELRKAQTERDHAKEQIKVLTDKLRRYSETKEEGEKGKTAEEIGKLETERDAAEVQVTVLEKIRDQVLVVRAPCSGVIGQAPSIEEITKFYQADPTTPFCTINEPGKLRVCMPIVTPEFNQLKESLEQVSRAATASRKLMKERVNLACDKTPLPDVLANLQKQVKRLHFQVDGDSRVSDELRVTYKAEDQRLGMALDAIFEQLGLGYVILSEPDGAHDGWLLIRPGRARGEPEGGRSLADQDVTIRLQGRDSSTWKGKIKQLPESEAKTVPMALSNRAGGPVAVKAGAPGGALIPSTQHYLVYIDIDNPDDAMIPGTMAQVKIYCQPETCLSWLWRTLNNTFDLGLM
jgi:multidrug efflux pump subunit AcrA (membrane-fusion protein)